MNRVHARFGKFLAAVAVASLAAGVAQAAEGLVFPAPPERVVNMPNGDKVEVYKANVLSVRRNRLTVRFPNGERYTYEVPEDFRFDISGQKLSVHDLKRGDELHAYITKHPTSPAPVLNYIDETAGAPAREVAQVEPTATPDPDEGPMMPHTASPMPLVGLLGGMAFALGALGMGIRRRMS